MFIKNRMYDVRQQLNEDLKNSSIPIDTKNQLKNLNLEAIEKQMIALTRRRDI